MTSHTTLTRTGTIVYAIRVAWMMVRYGVPYYARRILAPAIPRGELTTTLEPNGAIIVRDGAGIIIDILPGTEY